MINIDNGLFLYFFSDTSSFFGYSLLALSLSSLEEI